jgi:hypothetical protein
MEGLIVKNRLETTRKDAAKFEALYRYFTGWVEEKKEHSFAIADLVVEIMNRDATECKATVLLVDSKFGWRVASHYLRSDAGQKKNYFSVVIRVN